MKIAYFDCFSGISGDMFVGALLDAGLEFEKLKAELSKLNLSDYEISSQKVVKQNIASTKFDVTFPEQHAHRHLRHLNEMVENSGLAAPVIEKAKDIFRKIAEAEAKIHDMPVEKVHFHEVGAIDTIVDVVGAIVGLELLGVEKVFASPLNVGSGFVTFSHGRFPVPAPATSEILKGVPTYSNETKGELVTPTGAAIITALASGFGDMPNMTTESIGYGAGSKDLEQPNVLRVFIGEAADTEQLQTDSVSVIETNIDDMNPQIFGVVMEKLFEAQALDVFLTPIYMKKNRPGTRLTVLCRHEQESALARMIIEETTAIGVRIRRERRLILERSIDTIDTPYGKVRVKRSLRGGETVNISPEFEDINRIAQEKGIPFKKIYQEISRLISD